MPDFVEANDAARLAQCRQAAAVMAGNPAAYGQTNLTVAAFVAEIDAYENSLADHDIARAAARAATAAKDAQGERMVAALRAGNRLAQAQPEISADVLAVAGLPVHDTARARSHVPSLRPLVMVEAYGQEHRITFMNPQNNRAAMPDGARGVELYRAMVAAGEPLPIGIDQMTMVGTYSASRIRLQYPGGTIGRTVVYLARYTGTRQGRGPAGSTSVASIAA
jgi:hypothetical protein